MIVGIDFGTTYSAIAALDERGRPITLPNRDGDMLTPSAVYFADDRVIVGQAALDAAFETPDRVATLIKRRMGFPDFGRDVAGRAMRPETLAAIVLKKLVRDAESRIGPVRRAVITVPAYFDDTRRKATETAGRIAGLDVIDVLDEPSAAALAYAAQQSTAAPDSFPEQTVLVYDLGGGTFDATLVRLARRHFRTIAIEGDVRLGGKDWDDRIVERVAAEFVRRFGADPREHGPSLVLLQAAAERAKRTLSKLTQTTLTCSHAGHVLTMPITRAEFESWTRDLLTRTRLTVQQLIRGANTSWDRIDRILMVGGSTHMPMTAQMLREVSGREPDRALAVSEVVARGAAIHAGIVAARADASDPALADAARAELAQVVEVSVIGHSLGVEVRSDGERINDIVIPKNTQLPAEATRIYHTVAPGQKRVRVLVLQGEARQADACIPVGACWIDDLPPHLPERSPVEVRCACAQNGIVEVFARDLTSGAAVRAELERTGGLSESELLAEQRFVDSLTID